MDSHDWDARYAGQELLWSAEPNRFLVSEVADLVPARALDLACGEGRNAVWLAGQGWDVTGVDFSPLALEKARTLGAARRVEVTWVLSDVLEYVPTASFDLIVVLYLQLPSEQRGRVFRTAASALAPGGTLLVVGHDRTNLASGWGGPRDPRVLYRPDEVAADLSDLEIVKQERVKRTVATEGGERVAIDVLVRATRSA